MLLLFSNQISAGRKVAYVGISLIVLGIVLSSFPKLTEFHMLPWVVGSLVIGVSLTLLVFCPEKSLLMFEHKSLNAIILGLTMPVVTLLVGSLVAESLGLGSVEEMLGSAVLTTPLAVLVVFIAAMILSPQSK